MKPDKARDSTEVMSLFGMSEEEMISFGLFNPTYYLELNPDVDASGLLPLRHFIEHGLAEGRPPSILFSREDYVEMYPDVQEASVEPFIHYCRTGFKEHRFGTHEARKIMTSGLFDPVFYKTENPDVVASGADPLAHYLEDGGREGRQPCAEFDMDAFRRAFPGLDLEGVNPVLYYLTALDRHRKSI